MNRYYYSIDSGNNWEGPFSRQEFDSLVRMGLVDAATQVREEPAVVSPPAGGGGPGMPPPVGPHYSYPGVSTAGDEDQYIVMKNGAPNGPYPVSFLQGMLQRGEVQSSDLVWKKGMPEWVPLAAVAALVPLVMSTGSGLAFPSPGSEAGNAFMGGAPGGMDASLPGAGMAGESSGWLSGLGKIAARGARRWQDENAGYSQNNDTVPDYGEDAYDEIELPETEDFEMSAMEEMPDVGGTLDSVELPEADGGGLLDLIGSFFE